MIFTIREKGKTYKYVTFYNSKQKADTLIKRLKKDGIKAIKRYNKEDKRWYVYQ